MNYYIQGDAARAEQIKAAFEKLGYSTSLHTFFDEDTVFITLNGNICECNYGGAINELIKTHPDYKELELPKLHYDISNFKAGMPVLVRDYNHKEWCYLLYSHYTGESLKFKFNAGSVNWKQCIPYNDDTKHLLGTTDMPDEMYINW